MNKERQKGAWLQAEGFAAAASHAANRAKENKWQEALQLQAKALSALAEQLRFLGLDGDQADQLAYVLLQTPPNVGQ